MFTCTDFRPPTEHSSVGAELNQRSKMSQETSSSSSKSCRHPNCKSKTTTGKCLVTLNEIFDKGDSTTAAADRFLDREELPNEILDVHLPNVGVLINGFRRELAEDGLDLIVENGNRRVLGYAPRNDYNGQREVKAKMAKFLISSKSLP